MREYEHQEALAAIEALWRLGAAQPQLLVRKIGKSGPFSTYKVGLIVTGGGRAVPVGRVREVVVGGFEFPPRFGQRITYKFSGLYCFKDLHLSDGDFSVLEDAILNRILSRIGAEDLFSMRRSELERPRKIRCGRLKR